MPATTCLITKPCRLVAQITEAIACVPFGAISFATTAGAG